MNVLAVSASPRLHGNSDLLCDQFLKGAAESGHTTEKIRLAEFPLAPCCACEHCRSAGGCVKQDGMAGLLQKLVDTDVIVLATPVYFYSMCAQMKLFIDRCYPRFKEIQNKAFYLIVTCANPQRSGAAETLAGLRGYLRCLPGSQERGVIYGTGAWDQGDILRHPAYEKAFEAGKSV